MDSRYKKLLKHLDKKYPGLYMNVVHIYNSFNGNLTEKYIVYVEDNINHNQFKTFKEMQEWILTL